MSALVLVLVVSVFLLDGKNPFHLDGERLELALYKQGVVVNFTSAHPNGNAAVLVKIILAHTLLRYNTKSMTLPGVYPTDELPAIGVKCAP